MNSLKKIIVSILALAMVLSLCACGKIDVPEFPGLPGKSDSSSQSGDTPEYTYTSTYGTIDIDSENYMRVLAYTDSGFYATYEEVVGDETPDGVVPEYEGQYWIYESRLTFINYDGQISDISGYSPVPRPQNGGNGRYSYTSSVYLSGLTVNSAGNLIVLENVGENWSEQEGLTWEDDEYWDYYRYVNSYYLRELSPDGTEISSFLIPTGEDESISGSLVLDKDGNFIVAGDHLLKAINMNGETVWEANVDEYVDTVACTPDGRVFITMWNGNSGESAFEVDSVSHTLGEPIEVPGDVYTFYAGGGDYPLYYTSGTVFYGLDPASGTSTRLFNWLDLDINSDSLSSLSVLSSGEIVGVTSNYSNVSGTFNFEKFSVNKVPYDSVAHKEVITLGTQSLGYEYKTAIIDFNRKNDKYRIEVIDYSEYNTEDDYSAGLTKMTTEIMAGNVPDILDLNGLPTTQLAAKGILEDLYPYIDSDSEFDRSDFFENVLAAFEHDGKLVSTVSGFSINTVLGASSLVGDTPGWTYADFNSALAQMRENVPECDPFDEYTTRDTMLTSCLGLDMANFVNWDTGEVNFETDEFVALLDFVSQFPESFDWENYDQSSQSTTEYRTSSGEQMLVAESIYSFDDIFFASGYFGGQPYTYIGYPTSSGTGNTISVNSGFAMTSSCSNKDAAWQFLRTFFTEDYQRDLYSLPLSKNLFNEKLVEYMTVNYMKDANGNYRLDENGEKIPVARLGTYGASGELQYFYALSHEQADKLVNLIETTTKTNDYNESINNIVKEQAAAYFSGQKSAQEVSKLVQSKANIYVNEQR